METTIVITGDRALEQSLARLDNATRQSVVNDALSGGAEIIRRDAEHRAPKRSGRLARSIRVIELLPRGDLAAFVKIETEKGFFQGDEYYGGFQELGWRAGRRPGRTVRRAIRTKDGRTKYRRVANPNLRKQQRSRRKIPGKHFIRNAFRARSRDAAEFATEYLWGRVVQEVSLGAS